MTEQLHIKRNKKHHEPLVDQLFKLFAGSAQGNIHELTSMCWLWFFLFSTEVMPCGLTMAEMVAKHYNRSGMEFGFDFLNKYEKFKRKGLDPFMIDGKFWYRKYE